MGNDLWAVPGQEAFCPHPGPGQTAEFPLEWLRAADWTFRSPQEGVTQSNDSSLLLGADVWVLGLGFLSLGKPPKAEGSSLSWAGCTCRAS